MKTAEAIHEALDTGVHFLFDCLRSGPISTRNGKPIGKGWHDFYREPTRTAGAHASLEGFLTCKLPAIQKRLATHAINPDKDIFEDYLIYLFHRRANDGWPPEKLDQRAEAEVTTTKLAKFAQCCHATSSPKGKQFAQPTMQLLLNACVNDSIAVGHSTNSNNLPFNPPSSYATAEVLRSRMLWATNEHERRILLDKAYRFLSPKDAPLEKHPWKLENIPWLRSALPILHVMYSTGGELLNDLEKGHSTRILLEQILHRLARQDYFFMGDMVVETYSFKDKQKHAKQRTDYVSFESSLLFCQTVLYGIQQALIPHSWLSHFQPLLLAWKGNRKEGYCHELLNPESIQPQKNRLSYICAILKTLALAEDVLASTPYHYNQETPMYVNPIRFTARDIVPNGKTAFLAMPFQKNIDLTEIGSELREVCIAHGFKLLRTDDLKEHDTDIPQRMWRDILQSDFVIAICDGKNPNVYYEIGLAHAIGRPVFLCARNRKDFTFDVRDMESCEFNDSKGGLVLLRAELEKFILKIKSNTPL